MTVDETSGEVFDSEAEQSVLAEWDAVALANYVPATPEEMERFLRVLMDRIEQGPRVVAKMYTEVHTAEEKYQHKFSDAVINGPYSAIGYARQHAHLESEEELRELNAAKEKLRYAEELLKALIAKSMVGQNINKSITAQFMGTPRRY